MAQIPRLKDLEARKRALVAESEVYRQTLTLQIQNIRLYNVRMQKKLALMRLANPLFLFGASVLGSRFFGGRNGKRKGAFSRVLGASIVGFRLFRQFGPVLQQLLFKTFARRRAASGVGSEEDAPAAQI